MLLVKSGRLTSERWVSDAPGQDSPAEAKQREKPTPLLVGKLIA